MRLILVIGACLIAKVTADFCGPSRTDYNAFTHMCCAGMVFARNTSHIICCQDRIFGLGDPTAKGYWSCCADQAFDSRYQVCDNGRPRAKPASENVARVTFPPTTTPYWDYDFSVETDAPTPRRPQTTMRRPRPTEPPAPPQPASCADRTYNEETQVCCGGYIYIRSTPTVLCCSGALFAIGEPNADQNWKCCAKTIYDRRRQYCTSNGIVEELRR